MTTASSPSKTGSRPAQLVEAKNEVLLIVQILATQPIRHSEYLNEKSPQLFVATGAPKFVDPKNSLDMGWQPTYQTEVGSMKIILAKLPHGQDRDSSIRSAIRARDYLKGLKDGLGARHTRRSFATSPTTYGPRLSTVKIVTLKPRGGRHSF